MANVLTAVTPKLLAQGLMSLRENAIMARLVNSAYSAMAGERGSTIDVPIPSAIGAVQVAPANTATNPGDIAPTSVPIVMDQWYEGPFQLSDKEMMEVMEGTIPMQATAAIRALANQVDNNIIARWQSVPFVVQTLRATVAQTPFDPEPLSGGTIPVGVKDVTNIRAELNRNLAPPEDRRSVVSPTSEGNLAQVRPFQDTSWTGSMTTLLQGTLNRKIGFDWFMDQNLPVGYTSGTITGTVTVKTATTPPAGATTCIVTTAGGGALDLKVGDIISFSAAGSGYHTITTATGSIGAAADATLVFTPGLKVALVGGTSTLTFPVVTGTGQTMLTGEPYKMDLAFQRDAFVFANRPLASVEAGLGSISQSAIDPISGIALRLEVTREFKRTRFSYDILWGSGCVRPELAVRYQY